MLNLVTEPVKWTSRYIHYMNIHKYPAVAGVSGHYLQVPPGIRALADGWPEASLLLMYVQSKRCEVK